MFSVLMGSSRWLVLLNDSSGFLDKYESNPLRDTHYLRAWKTYIVLGVGHQKSPPGKLDLKSVAGQHTRF